MQEFEKALTDESFGQVSMEDLEVYGEGIYYGFICNECKIAATGYQQT
ncbi:hypothetical protein U728_1592 [Clostridium botulinum 202F]|nr:MULTISPECIES: hypothetical protein [unclassified Clostridium]AIY80966.1 hypothetical protein U728_1592 [Clostridium botulinum 202F]KAI3344931.1 hypothetical protein CIT17_15040 [Clostridium botulinum]